MDLENLHRLTIPYTKRVHEVYMQDLEAYLSQPDLPETTRLVWLRRKRRAEILFKRFSKKEQTGN